jgi:hypothetical protein
LLLIGLCVLRLHDFPAVPADVAYWKDDGNTAAGALSGEIDQYPYVSLSIHTD